MPIICESVKKTELTEKAKFLDVENFIHVRNTELTRQWYDRAYLFPDRYENVARKIENFTVRQDDVWVISFAKCGSTWTQEMVWQICNDLDFEGGKTGLLSKKFPYFENVSIATDKVFKDSLSELDATTGRRYMKSHLPAPLLPKQVWTVKPKIIYVARNAKDVITSFYHHYRNTLAYSGSFDDFVELSLNDLTMFSPYDTHILDFWNLRNDDNILFLTYEDMKTDHFGVIKKVANFFGKTYTDEQISSLVDHLSFEQFSKNPAVNFEEELRNRREVLNLDLPDKSFRFVRKGVINSHKDEMTKEMIQKCNNWLETRLGDLKDDPEIRKIFYYE